MTRLNYSLRPVCRVWRDDFSWSINGLITNTYFSCRNKENSSLDKKIYFYLSYNFNRHTWYEQGNRPAPTPFEWDWGFSAISDTTFLRLRRRSPRLGTQRTRVFNPTTTIIIIILGMSHPTSWFTLTCTLFGNCPTIDGRSSCNHHVSPFITIIPLLPFITT